MAEGAYVTVRLTPFQIINLPIQPQRIFLRSLGFDPDREFEWWDDQMTGERIVRQRHAG